MCRYVLIRFVNMRLCEPQRSVGRTSYVRKDCHLFNGPDTVNEYTHRLHDLQQTYTTESVNYLWTAFESCTIRASTDSGLCRCAYLSIACTSIGNRTEPTASSELPANTTPTL